MQSIEFIQKFTLFVSQMLNLHFLGLVLLTPAEKLQENELKWYVLDVY